MKKELIIKKSESNEMELRMVSILEDLLAVVSGERKRIIHLFLFGLVIVSAISLVFINMATHSQLSVWTVPTLSALYGCWFLLCLDAVKSHKKADKFGAKLTWYLFMSMSKKLDENSVPEIEKIMANASLFVGKKTKK